MVKRAYKYRFYPTAEQAELLAKTFGSVRYIYNHILHWRTQEYYEEKNKIGYLQASAHFTLIKQKPELHWLNDVSSIALQQCVRNQQVAFKNFFDGRAKYPTFKKKTHRQSFELTDHGFSFKDGKLFIAKSKKPLKIKWSREIPSIPKTITISKDTVGRYFVSCLCEYDAKALPVINAMVGVDLGINDLVVTSNGFKSGNPRYTRKHEEQLTKLSRRHSKKKLGSKNRVKAKLKVARIHIKISDCRMDNLHKLSRSLINKNQVIAVETLKVKNMIKNPKLAKHIADASWGEFVRQLEYKAKWANRTLIKIDQWFPSTKRCSKCGYINNSLSLDIRSWTCPGCKTKLDRDANAAQNILTAGLAGLACGETVNPN